MTQIIDRPAAQGDSPEPWEPILTQVGLPPPPASVEPATELTMVAAINRALYDAMAGDDRVLVFGEDVATRWGLPGHRGAVRDFRPRPVFRHSAGRVRDHRCRGRPGDPRVHPVPEIQFDGFSYPAFDQIVSHLAKYRMRTHGDINLGVTVRIPSFGGIGAVEHHSSPPSRTGCTPPASRWSYPPHRPTRTGCCAIRSAAPTR